MAKESKFQLAYLALAAAALECLIALSGGPHAAADSIYDPARSRSMFADRKANRLGDVVTVVITETTVSVQDASSEVERSTSARAEGGTGGFFKILRFIPKATLGGSTTQKGSGTTARSSRLLTTITCKVSEVTPAGQLVLTGERLLKVNEDTQTIRFSGMIRPEDVQQDNTIASSQVADARIEVQGKGPIARHVKPGLLSRIFGFLS